MEWPFTEPVRKAFTLIDSRSGQARHEAKSILRDAIYELSDEISRLRLAGWRPIGTAPKDGKKVDLWSSKGFRVCNAAWDTISYSMDGSEDVDGWTCAEGHGSIEKAGPFTHWMSLPSAPTDQVR